MTYLIYSLVGILILTTYLNWHSPSLPVSILNRWLRWIFFSLASAYLVIDFEWSQRPFWLIATTAFLGWFLVETIYNWLLIALINKGEVPLFPVFRENRNGDEWPNQKRFIRLRDWLRRNQFHRIQAVQSEISNIVHLRSSIYQSEDGRIRLQILFIPQRTSTAACYTLSSILEDDRLIITDNLFLPFGGYYPPNWEVQRSPLQYSLKQLLRRHEKRLAMHGNRVSSWKEMDIDPVDELNHRQRQLQQTNNERGFLLPIHLQEEYGQLSVEGRYRIWKEIWLLNYLGIHVRYH